jgi:pre-mRNA-splicing factor ATP-dependent RNA helicase DHX15/PRP43
MNNIGILDPEGKNNNPLTNNPYSDRYKELAKFWSKLPVYAKIHEIIEDIKNNQILLCLSSTGSGKSLLLPKIALHTYNYNGKIAMTLPKQIITKSAAEFSALTLDVDLGQDVGYQYKGSPPEAKSNKTKILYCTDGTIVAKALNDPMLKEYDCVIVDEVHERKTQIDFLIYLLRETVKLRPEFKVIFMSATINTSIFEKYFENFKFKLIDLGGTRTYPITSHFFDKSIDYKLITDEGFKILLNILETDNPSKPGAHDIMLFVTSSNEAFTICKKLNNIIAEEKKGKCKITCSGDIFCIEVFAGMDEKKQELAQNKDLYKNNTKFTRKVVIATNVAESSLTIDGIKYVIDSGYELSSIFDPENRAKKLDRRIITQAQAKQRMGRGGRTEPGICYHLYTKQEFEDTMDKFPQPDIKTSDITSECLKLLGNSNINNIENLVSILSNFIEPPQESYIKVAFNNLTQLGAIEKGTITKLGKILINIPENNIFMATSILFGKIYNCSKEIMKISSLIDAIKGNISELYNLPTTILQDKQGIVHDNEYNKMVESLNNKFNNARSKFAHKNGDHISLLNIYDKFNSEYEKHPNNNDKLYEWTYDKFLKINPLLKAVKQYKKLKMQVNKIINRKPNIDDLGIKYHQEILSMDVNDRVICCLLLGFRLNTAFKNSNKDSYQTQFSKNIRINISKMSFLTLKDKDPKNVFYHELFISMGKNELLIVSNIPKKIIKLLG